MGDFGLSAFTKPQKAWRNIAKSVHFATRPRLQMERKAVAPTLPAVPQAAEHVVCITDVRNIFSRRVV